MRVILNGIAFDKRVALGFDLRFITVCFCGGIKTGEPGEKPSDQGETNSKINVRLTPVGIEPRPHWSQVTSTQLHPHYMY